MRTLRIYSLSISPCFPIIAILKFLVENQTIQTIFAIWYDKNHTPQRTQRSQSDNDICKINPYQIHVHNDNNYTKH